MSRDCADFSAWPRFDDPSAFDPLAGARVSSTVVVLRDDPQAGLQVLLLQRAQREDNDVRSGIAVFPGGVVDAADDPRVVAVVDGDRSGSGGSDGADALAAAFDRSAMDALVRTLGGTPGDGGEAMVVAAARECFEECGLLFARSADEGAAQTPAACIEALRERLGNPDGSDGGSAPAPFLQALRESGLVLDLSQWAAWAHWLTPPGARPRFDTRFFIAREPQGQQAVADGHEALDAQWLTPAQALDAAAGLRMVPVTRWVLAELQSFATVDAALAGARSTRREVRRAMGYRAQGRNAVQTVVRPGSPAWAEIALSDPLGRGHGRDHVLPGAPVRISLRVVRVTAPNPGVMTGPGTNTWIVADPQSGACVVIDPGPEIASHEQAIRALLPGPLRAILITHHHIDHAPGALPLAHATGAPIVCRAPEMALRGARERLVVQAVDDGHEIALSADTVLRAVHTPGHASDHLCWWLPVEGTLFSGDQVMQGSTVVIRPPDGNMRLYVESLQRLRELAPQRIAPAHGFVVGRPDALLQALIAHRLQREAKVLRIVRELEQARADGAQPEGATLDALVERVYDDAPRERWPIARHSLRAHLDKLVEDGKLRAIVGTLDGDVDAGPSDEADRWAPSVS